jgi:hypothetical protein
MNMANKKDTSTINDIKSKLNNTFPMVIVLSIVCVILLVYIYNHKNDDVIRVGNVNTGEVTIANVHYFKNDKMNYFYASPASYLAEDQKIFSFQIGYFVEDNKGNLIPFLTRSNKFEKSTSLKEVTLEMTSWNIIELESAHNYFTKEVNPYLHKLHFVIKASTKQGGEYDINIDKVVDYKKML